VWTFFTASGVTHFYFIKRLAINWILKPALAHLKKEMCVTSPVSKNGNVTTEKNL
jgi:hypothetical protein